MKHLENRINKVEEKFDAREPEKRFLGVTYKLGESDEIVQEKKTKEAKKHGGVIEDFNWINMVAVPPKKIYPGKMGQVWITPPRSESDEYGVEEGE
jgi:hypothetical protein